MSTMVASGDRGGSLSYFGDQWWRVGLSLFLMLRDRLVEERDLPGCRQQAVTLTAIDGSDGVDSARGGSLSPLIARGG